MHILGRPSFFSRTQWISMVHFRLHKTTNDYQEAMKLVDKQYLKIIEVQHTANYLQSNHFEPLIIN